MKKSITYSTHFLLKIFIFLYMIGLFASGLHASEFLAKKAITIAKSDTINDDTYIFASYGKINGTVNGDLAAFCYDVNSVGDIQGNANMFGYRVDLHGRVERSARLFGNYVNSNGDIGSNMLILGNEISVGDKAIIGRDLNCYGAKITVDGTIRRNLKISGDRIVISGTIEGNVDLEGQSILIVPPANIKGNLTYTSKKEATIEDGAVIQGEKTWSLPEAIKKSEKEKGGISIFSIILRIMLFMMAMITGLVILALFKDHTVESSKQIIDNFWITLARGCLAFIIFTVGVIALFVVILGIPLGILLISLGMILFYIGKIYVAISLGRYIFGLFNRQKIHAAGMELFLGLIVLTILFQIPYLGWLVYIGAFVLGTGAAVSGYVTMTKKRQPIAGVSS